MRSLIPEAYKSRFRIRDVATYRQLSALWNGVEHEANALAAKVTSGPRVGPRVGEFIKWPAAQAGHHMPETSDIAPTRSCPALVTVLAP